MRHHLESGWGALRGSAGIQRPCELGSQGLGEGVRGKAGQGAGLRQNRGGEIILAVLPIFPASSCIRWIMPKNGLRSSTLTFPGDVIQLDDAGGLTSRGRDFLDLVDVGGPRCISSSWSVIHAFENSN